MKGAGVIKDAATPADPRSDERMHWAAGLALAGLSAALLRLAFPPYNRGLWIGVAFVPMLVAQYRVLPRRGSSVAPAVAIGGWLGALLVPIFGGKSVFMVLLPLGVGALSLLLDRSKRAFHEATSFQWFVVEGAVGWVGLEMLRSLIPALGTWAFVGYPLWDRPGWLLPLSIVGIFGLDLVILVLNYAVALAIVAGLNRWEWGPSVERRLWTRWLAAAVAATLLWLGTSAFLGRGMAVGGETVRVAAVQPNLPKAAHRDRVTTTDDRLARLATLTRDAAAQGAQVVVWPEMALGFDPQVEGTAALAALARETDAILVIGYVVEGASGFRNEAVVLTPAGAWLGPYGKAHPMITSGEPQSVSAGSFPVYDTSVGRLATMICFDASFTDVSRAYGRQGVGLLAAPSLFGPTMASLPHTMVVLRAIENRVAVVMADVAYNSAIVDPWGRVRRLVVTPEGEALTLVAEVPLGTGRTLYARAGDWIGWLCLAGMIAFGGAMRRVLRRAS